MARVVQRRSNPPILLIVFVFLFLIATVVAVVGFMGQDKVRKELVATEDQMSELKEENAKLVTQGGRLVQLITGKTSGTLKSAIGAAEAAYDHPDYIAIDGERGGLANELGNLTTKVQAGKTQLAVLNAQIKNLNDQIAKMQSAQDELVKAHQDALKGVHGEKAKLSSDLTASQADRDKAVEDAKARLASTRKALQKEVKEKEKLIEKMILASQDQKKTISKLNRQIRELMDRMPGRSTEVKNKADGKILKLVRDADVCYINLGSKENVKPGTTFTVYSANGKIDNGAKGKIKATSVSSNFTECKIVEQSKTDPIEENDVVANLAFDAGRTYIFVVRGVFDLQNTGRATAAGATEVQDAITKFGGKVADEIDVQTDYVVMGLEPSKPSKPSEDAPPSVQRAYEQQLKRYKEYYDTKTTAENMKIPVLNTNRFIELTGYIPENMPS